MIHCDGICKCKGQVLVGEPDSGFDDENIDETSSDSSNSTAFKKKDAHGDRTIVGLDDGDDAHDCEIDRVNDMIITCLADLNAHVGNLYWLKISFSLISDRSPQT